MNHEITEIATNSHSSLNAIGEAVVYNWDPKYIKQSLKDHLDGRMKALFKAGFSFEGVMNGEFTGPQLWDLGFKIWSGSDDGDLWVIPIYMVNHIPKGMKLTNIFGGVEEFDPEETDKDNRFGCIAYGFVLPKARREELEEFVKFRKNEIRQEKTEKVAPYLMDLLDAVEKYAGLPKEKRAGLYKAIDEAVDEVANRLGKNS